MIIRSKPTVKVVLPPHYSYTLVCDVFLHKLLTQKLKKKMDNEKILLDALNTFGNFTSVEQEFNYNQLEAIYEAMNQVFHIAKDVRRRERLVCDVCGSTDVIEAPHMGRNCNRCHPL